MGHGKGVDGEPGQFEGSPCLKEPDLVDLTDRPSDYLPGSAIGPKAELVFPRQDAGTLDVIRVAVRNDDAVERRRVYAHRFQTFPHLLAGQARVDQNRRAIGLDKKRITRTAACQRRYLHLGSRHADRSAGTVRGGQEGVKFFSLSPVSEQAAG
jgi:hypothetical protein